MRGFFLLVRSWWGKGSFLAFWLLLGALCILGVVALSFLCVQGLGFKDVPPAGHALRAEVGGGIIFGTPGEFAGQHKWDGPISVGMIYVWFMGSGGIGKNCRQKQGETSVSPKNVSV